MDDQAQRLLVKDEFDERRGSDKKGPANRGTSSCGGSTLRSVVGVVGFGGSVCTVLL